MINDKALFLLLIGMLIYRTFDALSIKKKICQVFIRLDKSPLKLSNEIENSILSKFLRLVDLEFYIITMIVCLLILLFTGSVVILIGDDQEKDLEKIILASVTIFVSFLVSGVGFLIECLRLHLERS